MRGKRALRRRNGTKYIVGMVLATMLLTPSVLCYLLEKPQPQTKPPQVESAPLEGETPVQLPPPPPPEEPTAPELPPSADFLEGGAEIIAAPPTALEEAESPEELSVSFDNAVFLGDSRTEGFYLYSGLTAGQYLYAQGATVESIFTKATQQTENGSIPMLDALDAMEFSTVYIMLGVNELGWPQTQTFYQQYGKVVDRIRETHPDAKIVLQSILPVSAKPRAKRGAYVNNDRITEYNELIRTLAEEKSCTYLDVAAAVSDENGCLPDTYSYDGVHLNTAGCHKWLECLQGQPV